MKTTALLLLLWLSGVVAAEIAVPAGLHSQLPNWTVDAQGRPWLSWVEPREGSWVLRGAFATGGGFSEPTDFASGRGWFINWADTPGLVLRDEALTPYGLVYTHDGRGYGLWIGEPDRFIHRDRAAVEHGFFSAARGWGIWLDGQQYASRGVTEAQTELRARRMGSDDQETVLDARVCDCCGTAALELPDGFVVAYRDRSEADVRDISVVRFVDGAFDEPRQVHSDGWVIRGCPVNGPVMARVGDRIAIAWFTLAQDRARVRVALAPIETLDFAPPIEVDATTPIGRVSMASLSNGFIVVWLRAGAGDDDAEIRFARFDASGMRVAEGIVGPSSSRRTSGFPRIARVEGAVWVAYTDVDADRKTTRVRVRTVPAAH